MKNINEWSEIPGQPRIEGEKNMPRKDGSTKSNYEEEPQKRNSPGRDTEWKNIAD